MYSYSLGLYEKAFPKETPLEEKLAAAKECGFDHMELCIDPEPSRAQRINWTKAQQREVRRMGEDAGIPFTTLSLSLLRNWPLGLIDDNKNRIALDAFQKGVDIAAELGSRVMLINGYDVYGEASTPETRARFLENLPKLAEICEKAGVMVGVENAEQEFCSCVRQARDIVAHSPSPYLGIYADMGNSANSTNGDTAASLADIRTGAGKIFAMHVKDTLPGDYRFTPYGSGHVDFAKAISLAKELHIRIFTAELFYREGVEPIAEAKRVNAFIRNYFDREE